MSEFDFGNATSEELMAWKSHHAEELQQSPQEVRDKLDGIIMQKIANEATQKAVNELEALKRGKEWDSQAEKDWPELKDKESELYKKTVEAMEEDPNAAMKDPYAYYNHATRVGISMGMLPAGQRQSAPGSDPMDGIGAGEGAPAGPAPESKGEEFLKNSTKIAEAYRDVIDIENPDTRERLAKYAEEDSDG